MSVLQRSPNRQSDESVPPADQRCGRRLVLAGYVQGLGVRPAIFRLASELALDGIVRNTLRGVEIELEGAAALLESFEDRLPGELPTGSVLQRLDVEAIRPIGRREFAIEQDGVRDSLAARVPQDRMVCSECQRETDQPLDRRHEYAFTSCSQCGPRYTVVRSMPFEREDSSLADFPLCVDCRHEYRGPRDRRFHAQTITCPKCGPRLWCTLADGVIRLPGETTLQGVVRLLQAGKIVAARGLGGYQLLVDATSEEAVARLRARKRRPAKPLAVLVENLAEAERLAYADSVERKALTDPAGPIVLLRARRPNELAVGVAPRLDTIGLMLPTTPLHALLVRACGRPLICTSGNSDGEPLAYQVEPAEQQLAGIADAWLHHNREIVRPIDDSVVRAIAGRVVTLRLARGLAPLTLELSTMPPALAVGGYLKSAVAWSNGAQSVLGPHIGDQQSLAARERFHFHLKDWQQLYHFEPQRLVHDMHPDYYSTHYAQGLNLPTDAVQHHHAHVLAGMLEQGWLDRTVLGVAWDGTGYGTDGAIWGGEFLVATAGSFERVARLRPFRLPGGEAAIHEPWRTAASICSQLDGEWGAWRPAGWNVEPSRVAALEQVVRQPQLSPLTTSAGRLFDAAASLVLGVDRVAFDGQAAMQLEAIADRTVGNGYYLSLENRQLTELDWRPMFGQLLNDLRSGVQPGVLSMRFHRGLAQVIVKVCQSRAALPVVLAGGVFQNRLLTELVVEYWDDNTQPLGLPGRIPPNDGGLAAGQLAFAATRGIKSPCA